MQVLSVSKTLLSMESYSGTVIPCLLLKLMAEQMDGPLSSTFQKCNSLICLLQQNAGAALEQLRRMPSCAEYSPAILEVVCHEAVHAGIHSVACDALSLLHEAVAKGEVENMCEADVLRVHIRCDYETRLQSNSKDACSEASPDSWKKWTRCS
eukprot:scaffold62598_cov18-Tisochrysis_lutea.AAC.1